MISIEKTFLFKSDMSGLSMLSIYNIAIILSLCDTIRCVFVNDFDGKLDFKCLKETQTISRVHSIHDNRAEDRRFEFECREIGQDTENGSPHCTWSANFENVLDQVLEFECPDNGFINGMISEHDNRHEDRQWKFYCCRIQDIHLYDCNITPWTNDLDQLQDYRLPADKVMKGVFSQHDNRHEDRRYKYEICNAGRFQSGEPIVG